MVVFQQCFNNNIVLLSQLFHQDGQLYNYAEFIRHYGIPIPLKLFSIVFNAVPSAIISLFKGFKVNNNHPVFVDATEESGGKIWFSLHSKNK